MITQQADEAKDNIPENSPKNEERPEDSEESEISDFLVYESDGSSKYSDTGEWCPIDQKTIAVDYSNVPVFLKTLRTWKEQEQSAGI